MAPGIRTAEPNSSGEPRTQHAGGAVGGYTGTAIRRADVDVSGKHDEYAESGISKLSATADAAGTDAAGPSRGF